MLQSKKYTKIISQKILFFLPPSASGLVAPVSFLKTTGNDVLPHTFKVCSKTTVDHCTNHDFLNSFLHPIGRIFSWVLSHHCCIQSLQMVIHYEAQSGLANLTESRQVFQYDLTANQIIYNQSYIYLILSTIRGPSCQTLVFRYRARYLTFSTL